jgi:hypothetical protein
LRSLLRQRLWLICGSAFQADDAGSIPAARFLKITSFKLLPKRREAAGTLSDGRGWTTLLSSDALDDWRLRVGHLLGPHEIRQVDAPRGIRFHHRIRSASAGPLQLVEFRGGGSYALERIQAPGRAVLWLPSLGVVEERVEGATLQPHPGMGLWIRPNTALVGRIHGRCSGISIVVPTALLEGDDEQGYRVDPEAGPMLLNPFTRQRSGAVVNLLRVARQLAQTVESGGSGFTLQALINSLIEQLQAWDRIALPGLAFAFPARSSTAAMPRTGSCGIATGQSLWPTWLPPCTSASGPCRPVSVPSGR